MPGPLEGIRIFDLTIYMVGPWAAVQLGALGADVIHIEQPNVDPSTLGAGVPPKINGTSVGYITWNMNKRGLFLDLKTPQDRATAYELLKTCDVFMVNMRTGTADRLGLSYEAVAEINPQIVYCSITGFGETGPMATRPGADGQMQYFSGFWSTNGAQGGEREIYRHFTQMDGSTGNYAAQAILMGLLARKRTGRGQRIEVSMLRATTALQTARIGEYMATGEVAKPLGSAAFATTPDEAFLCEDSLYLGISVTNERDWRALCHAIDRQDLLSDARFATNVDRVAHRNELSSILAPVFRDKPQYHWMMQLTRAGVPCGYPMRFEELRYHPQVTENDYIIESDTSAWGRLYTGGPPWHFSETPARWTGTPLPGEHTGDVLDELQQRRAQAVPEAAGPA
jgi:crotonobetainyl-CoA:carnitine CoA-transferase CaiB-like acyl-CoA transferase